MLYGVIYDYEFKHPNPSTFESVNRQYFSIPFGIISYITQTPLSADGLSKLQKTCKYFFAKNKIVIVRKDLFHKESFYCRTNSKKVFYLNNSRNIKFKFWLTTNFDNYGKPLNLKNIYRCTLHTLHIQSQDLSLNEIDFLLNGGKVTELWLENIYDEKSKNFLCARILSKVQNVLNLDYFSKNEVFTNETFQKMIQISNSFNLKPKNFHIGIYNLCPDADIKLLCEFIPKNTNKLSRFYFYMGMNITEIHKAILKTAVEKMLQNWKTETTTPDVSVFN